MDSQTARAEVEQFGHVKLPPATRNLQRHLERGIDAALWARFELPAAELDAFLASAGYAELSGTDRAVENWHLPTKAAWWTPDAIASFHSGRLRREDTRPRYAGHVLASADGEVRTVYLFVNGL